MFKCHAKALGIFIVNCIKHQDYKYLWFQHILLRLSNDTTKIYFLPVFPFNMLLTSCSPTPYIIVFFPGFLGGAAGLCLASPATSS